MAVASPYCGSFRLFATWLNKPRNANGAESAAITPAASRPLNIQGERVGDSPAGANARGSKYPRKTIARTDVAKTNMLIFCGMIFMRYSQLQETDTRSDEIELVQRRI